MGKFHMISQQKSYKSPHTGSDGGSKSCESSGVFLWDVGNRLKE